MAADENGRTNNPMKTTPALPALLRRSLYLMPFLLLPSVAQAHPGHGAVTGFASGSAHPLLGMDHLCAMVAVGLWAAQRGGRALWAVPLAFVSVMMLGAATALGGHTIPFAEQGIAASVLVLGILIAAAIRLPLAASMVLVGAFALFHGFAHGAEIPTTASGFAFGAGMVFTTADLHLSGIAAGLAAQKVGREKFVCRCGWAVAACGLGLAIAR
jgi:urease accessory protein